MSHAMVVTYILDQLGDAVREPREGRGIRPVTVTEGEADAFMSAFQPDSDETEAEHLEDAWLDAIPEGVCDALIQPFQDWVVGATDVLMLFEESGVAQIGTLEELTRRDDLLDEDPPSVRLGKQASETVANGTQEHTSCCAAGASILVATPHEARDLWEYLNWAAQTLEKASTVPISLEKDCSAYLKGFAAGVACMAHEISVLSAQAGTPFEE